MTAPPFGHVSAAGGKEAHIFYALIAKYTKKVVAAFARFVCRRKKAKNTVLIPV